MLVPIPKKVRLTNKLKHRMRLCDALCNRAASYFARNNQTFAILNWKKCLRLDPYNAYAHAGLGASYAINKKFKCSIEHSQLAIKYGCPTAVPYLSLANCFAFYGDFETVEEILTDARVYFPDMAQIHFELFVLYCTIGDKKAARTCIKKALRLEPENIEYLAQCGSFCFNSKNLTGAKQCADQLIKRVPRDFRGHELLGLYHLTLGNYNEAISKLETALALNPCSKLIQENLDLAIELLDNNTMPLGRLSN